MMKTAIIGAGPHGKRLVQVCQSMPEISVSGVVDRRSEVLESFSNLPDKARFTSTKELYNSVPDLDMVLIATNGPSHATLAIEAMQNGVKRVMVEKPMACSVEECLEMERVARELGVRLSVDKTNRFSEAYQYIRKNLVNGSWGHVRTIFIQHPGIGLGCLGTHYFDLANYFIDKFPQKVTGWVDSPKLKNPRGDEFVDPGGLVICDYGNDTKAIINQIEDGAGPLSIEIHTTSARVIFDPKNELMDIWLRDLSVIPGPGRPPKYDKISPPEGMNLKGDMIGQLKMVVSELMSEDQMLTDSVYGTAATQILVAAYVSHEKGNVPVTLPLTDIKDLKKYLPVT